MDAVSFVLPEAALEERFLAATGPGGQNVNKVATAVQIRLDVFALRLSPPVYARLKQLAGSRWTNEGEIVLDPFSGSGTTAEMARNLGRRSIGLEINPEYVEISRKRMAQQLLFGAEG